MTTPKVDRIFLVGISGAGKSSVATVLASRLGWKAQDTDAEVERRTGRTIPWLFANKGEAVFRGFEQSAVLELAGRPRQVVAWEAAPSSTPLPRHPAAPRPRRLAGRRPRRSRPPPRPRPGRRTPPHARQRPRQPPPRPPRRTPRRLPTSPPPHQRQPQTHPHPRHRNPHRPPSRVVTARQSAPPLPPALGKATVFGFSRLSGTPALHPLQGERQVRPSPAETGEGSSGQPTSGYARISPEHEGWGEGPPPAHPGATNARSPGPPLPPPRLSERAGVRVAPTPTTHPKLQQPSPPSPPLNPSPGERVGVRGLSGTRPRATRKSLLRERVGLRAFRAPTPGQR